MDNPSRRFDPKAFLAEIGEGHRLETYCKDRPIFSQGEPADAVFYIQSGKVKVVVASKQGKEAVVAILSTDEFVGEGGLAGQSVCMATAVAMTDAIVVRLEKSAIQRVIREEPAFSEMFIAHILSRNIRVEADLVDQLFNSSEKLCIRRCQMMTSSYANRLPHACG